MPRRAKVILERLLNEGHRLRLGRYRIDYDALDEAEREYDGTAWMLVSRNTKAGERPYRLTLFDFEMEILVHFSLDEEELDLGNWAKDDLEDDPFRAELQDYVDPNIQGWSVERIGPGEAPVPVAEAGGQVELSLSKEYAQYGSGFFDVRVAGLPGVDDFVVQRLPGGRLKIEIFGVQSGMQRHGEGTAAIRALERWAAAQGVRRIFLDSTRSAVPFWEKMGFVRGGGRASEPDWLRMQKVPKVT